MKHGVEINGAVDDPNLLAYMITVDGTAVSDRLPYLWDNFAYSDGNHTIRIDAADKAGNRASKEITVKVDNTLPVVQINFPPDGAFIKGVIDLTVDVFDANLDRFQIFINGVLIAENQKNFRWNTSEYPDGAYMIEVVAYDQAGNEMRRSVNVTVDNTVPVLVVNQLTDNPTLEYPAYRINGKVEPDSIIVINGNTITHSGSFEYTMNVTEGTNVITVTATDRAGNSASWTKNRLVDSDDLPVTTRSMSQEQTRSMVILIQARRRRTRQGTASKTTWNFSVHPNCKPLLICVLGQTHSPKILTRTDYFSIKHSLQSWDLCPRLSRRDFYPAENQENQTAIDN